MLGIECVIGVDLADLRRIQVIRRTQSEYENILIADKRRVFRQKALERI